VTPEQFQRVAELLLAARELEPAERPAFVHRSCAGDREVESEVLSLLAAEASRGPMLAASGGTVARAAFEISQLLAAEETGGRGGPPLQIGPYRIIRKIGEGGMGCVYEAEQQFPRRTVAVKTLRGESLTDKMIHRFVREANVLGQLDHQGIARIYEAGTSQIRGATVPFFAMELVRGETLTDYAERRKLGVSERLELMAGICDAVQHAHQKGVIHRDLKPGNILVVEEGTEAQGHEGMKGDAARERSLRAFVPSRLRAFPKILDFGVARLTSAESGVATAVNTLTGQLIGTLQYMSPEQVSGHPEAIDYRSDIYSLGVIMYELLAGRLPYNVRGRSLPEAARIIREDEPSRLSSINSDCHGDVETIVAKALEKDPARRYTSAAELALDLRRFLANQPIIARPASTFYQLRKFARRHRDLVVGIALAFCVLIAGLVAVSWLALEESHHRRVAEANVAAAQWASYRNCMAAVENALAMRDVARARQALRSAPPEMRGWEWRYFNAALDQSALIIPLPRGHRGASFSRDGLQVLSGSLHPPWRAARWDLATGRRLADGDAAEGLRLLLQPSQLAGMWNLGFPPGAPISIPARTGKQNEEILREKLGIEADAFIRSAVLSPAERWLAFDAPRPAGRAIWIVDTHAATGRIVHSHDGVGNWVLEFSLDEQMLAGADYRGDMHVWEVETGRRLASLRGHSDRIAAARFSPDDRRIASASWDNTVRAWEVGSWKPVGVGRGHVSAVESISFRPDGRHIATGGRDGTIRLWDADTLEPLSVYHGHEGTVFSVTFSPDGRRLVSAGADETIRIWEAEREHLDVLRGHSSYVYSIAISPDSSTLASGGWDHTVRLWDLRNRTEHAVLKGHQGNIYQVAFAPDGRHLVSSADDFTLRVWNLRSRTCVAEKRDYEAFRMPPAFAADNERIILPCTGQGKPTAWNFRTGVVQEVTSAELREARGHHISPDGRWRACMGATLDVIAHAGDRRLSTSQAQSGPGWPCPPLAFSPDGRRAAHSRRDYSVCQLNLESGREVGVLRGHTSDVFAIAYSPDGTRIASGGNDQVIRLWDAERSEESSELRGHSSYVSALQWSPDGSMLLSASGDYTIRIWRAKPR